MKVSIQTKLFGMYILLVLLTTIGISGAYYTLAKREKHRESRERIQIAFDIIFKEQKDRLNSYARQFEEFLKQDNSINWVASSYKEDKAKISSTQFALFYLVPLAKDFKNLGGYISLLNRVSLYTYDKRLLFMFHRDGKGDSVGGYVMTESGTDTYAPFDDSAKISEMMVNDESFPERPLPLGATPLFQGEFPDETSTGISRDGQNLSFWVVVPLYEGEEKLGILVGEAYYTKSIVEGYVSLSRTDVNLFAGNQLSIGTLPVQTALEPSMMERIESCEDMLSGDDAMDVFAMTFENQNYYQGRCALKDFQGKTVGAITVSLSQKIEEKELRSILMTVLVVAAIAIILAFGIIVVTSRKSVRFIQQLITYIDRLAKGDIPKKITRTYKGEFEQVRRNLNSLIEATNETTRVAEAIANGKLDVEVKERSEHDRLMKALNQMIDAFLIPLGTTLKYITRIAKGDIPEKLTQEYQGDFNEIKDNLNTLIDAMNAITELAQEMAAGKLLVEVKERSGQDTLMQALNTMIQHLKDVVIHVKETTDNVTGGSEHLSQASEQMSQGASVQAASAEEVSSSMEQMTANIRQNAENARQTETIALQSAAYAEEGGKVVAETIKAMQQIAEKITIIQEIADQTRMLSLNATIEAVRAQEHGKAFSVVAVEVRKLSDITKRAAEEINTLVTSSLDISERAGEMLMTLLPSTRKTTELVQEISMASREQSLGAEQVNMAIQQLDQVTQQNAATAEELAASATELTMQAKALQQTIAFFKLEELPDKPSQGGSVFSPEIAASSGRLSEEPEQFKTDGDGIELNVKNREEVEDFADTRDLEFEKY